MTFRKEFPDFDPATMPEIPAAWRDVSWHNDACPCFNAGNGKIVFVDYDDPQAREFFGETKRFSVHADPEIHNSNDCLFDSDNWQSILDFVATGRKA
jgi:hypothetical protein